jgi:hypothetical protein
MSCPRCGSNDLWDDNLWWGCNSCGYAGNESGNTWIFAKDLKGLSRSEQELKEQKIRQTGYYSPYPRDND